MGPKSVRDNLLVSAAYAAVVAWLFFLGADLVRLIADFRSSVEAELKISVALQFVSNIPLGMAFGLIAVGLAGSSDRRQRRFGFAAILFGIALFLSVLSAAIMLRNGIDQGYIHDRQIAAQGLAVLYLLLQVIAAPIAAVGFFRAAKTDTSAFVFRDRSLGWAALLLAVGAVAYAASHFLLATPGSKIGPGGLFEGLDVTAGANLVTAFGWIVAAIAFFNAHRAGENSPLGGIGRRDGLIGVSVAIILIGRIGVVIGEVIFVMTLSPIHDSAAQTESWLRVIGACVELIATAYVSMAFWRSYRGQTPRALENRHDEQEVSPGNP